MRPRSASGPWSRLLEPIGASIWILFLVLSVLVACSWAFGWGEAEIRERVAVPDLQQALIWIWQGTDMVWVTLAAVNTYFHLASTYGVPLARRWTAIILATVLVLCVASTWFGWPLGPIRYTRGLGPLLGGVGAGVLLLWFTLFIGARDLVWRAAPKLHHAYAAMATGAVFGATHFAVDPIAWKLRSWWLWYPGDRSVPWHAPMQAPIVWVIAGGALAWMLRDPQVARPADRRQARPVIISAVLVGVLLLGRLGWTLGW